MNEDNIKIKEEGEVKTWIKKHKTGLAVGVTALVGLKLTMAAYRFGFREGRHFGYEECLDFMENGVESFNLLEEK